MTISAFDFRLIVRRRLLRMLMKLNLLDHPVYVESGESKGILGGIVGDFKLVRPQVS